MDLQETEPVAFGHIRLAEVIGALSYAFDLTEGQPPGHSLRCAWIGMHVGREVGPNYGLNGKELSELYYTLLLKDAGCSSNAARLWSLYGGDERLVKHDYKTVDTQSMLQLAQFVLRHAGPGEALRARVRRLLDMARNGDDQEAELAETRSRHGADIVRALGFSEAVADAVHALDEHWNGKGRPIGRSGADIPIGARITLLAQVAELFHTVGGPAASLAEVRRRAGTWFDPALVAAFEPVAAAPGFWTGLTQDGLDIRVAALEPQDRIIQIDEDRLDRIAETFADLIDAKSGFTDGHSRRVAVYAVAMGAGLDLSSERQRWLRRAALLHDIGKLGVSNAILDKPGRLDEDEYTVVKRHAELSEAILQRVSVFREMAPIAAAHHERPDGTGYPKRLRGADIPLEARIITVADIFAAITAARPYRGPMPLDRALALMERERDTVIDGACLEALKRSVVPGFVPPA